MKIIRWTISGPIAIGLFLVLGIVFDWLLGWLFKILSLVMAWGTRYDTPNIFDFEAKISDLKSFIFGTCLAFLLAAACAGFVGGRICPPRNSKAAGWLMGILIIPIIAMSIVSFWNSEHWFYSILWIIDMALAATIFVSVAVGTNEE